MAVKSLMEHLGTTIYKMNGILAHDSSHVRLFWAGDNKINEVISL